MKLAMQSLAIVLLLFAHSAHGQSATEAYSAKNPIGSVVNLLKKLQRDSELEEATEAKTYETYVEWCEESKDVIAAAIKKEKTVLEEHEVEIEAKHMEDLLLTTQIKVLEKQIADNTQSRDAAAKARDEAHQLYVEKDEELTSTIAALEQAMTTMESACAEVDAHTDGATCGDYSSESTCPSYCLWDGAACQLIATAAPETIATVGEATQSQANINTVNQPPATTEAATLPPTTLAPTTTEAPTTLAPTTTAFDPFARSGFGSLLQNPLIAAQLTDEQRQMLLNAAAPAPAPLVVPGSYTPGETVYNKHSEKYEKKSCGIVDMIKKLKEKFEDDKSANTNLETVHQNEYLTSSQQLDKALLVEGHARDVKVQLDAEIRAIMQRQQAERAVALQEISADVAVHDDLITTCSVKKSEWEERQKVRFLEISALKAAERILGLMVGKELQPEVPENAAMPSSPAAVSFLQVEDPKHHAINLLRQEAEKKHYTALVKFAHELETKLGGPFAQVDTMLQGMIYRLMAEQKDEIDHKSWCDTQITKTNHSITLKLDKIDDLTASLDSDKATALVLMNDVKVANDKAQELTEHMAEATRIRKQNKLENEQAMKDAKAAQEALLKAQDVIVTFYKKTGAVELQVKQFSNKGLSKGVDLPEEPSTWDSSYTKVADPNNQPDGIITIIQAVSSDFARMEADTRSQEQQDVAGYKEQMKMSEVQKAQMNKEAELYDEERQRLLAKVSGIEKSVGAVNEELEALQQYAVDLEPACKDGTTTFEERKAARDAEIALLKQTQQLLKNAASGAPAPAPAEAGFLSSKKAVARKSLRH